MNINYLISPNNYFYPILKQTFILKNKNNKITNKNLFVFYINLIVLKFLICILYSS